MPVQVAAHGFDLTPSLRESCEIETHEKLMPLAQHTLAAKWILSLEHGEHIAHLNWNDGGFHGDVTVKSEDMYTSIKLSVKKAGEQIKKAHHKRNSH